MSRKGVGRGRKYTTRVNKGGGQEYSRRPLCGVIVIYGPGLLLALVTAYATRGVWS